MGGTKKTAVDRVIENLEAEKLEIDRTIARLKQANAAAPKRPRKPKAGAAESR